MLYTITSLAGYPIQILHSSLDAVVSSCCSFIGKSFPYISCLSLHGLHEESTDLLKVLHFYLIIVRLHHERTWNFGSIESSPQTAICEMISVCSEALWSGNSIWTFFARGLYLQFHENL